MTTSNITGALELAFLDRTDLRIYMGKPKPEAIYRIYREGIHELIKVQREVKQTVFYRLT